jgi:hypothetical protein
MDASHASPSDNGRSVDAAALSRPTIQPDVPSIANPITGRGHLGITAAILLKHQENGMGHGYCAENHIRDTECTSAYTETYRVDQ